ELMQSILFRITGTVTDDPARGIPVPAAILGFCFRRKIEFVKRYPESYLFHEGKAVTLSEAIQTLYNDHLVEEQPRREIRYMGSWNSHNGEFEGIWVMTPLKAKLASGRWLKSPASTGTWRMFRSDS